MLARYGGKCFCCGETRWEFLALDHINGGGSRERGSRIYTPGNGMYWWLKKNNWPKGFRAACHNCNSAAAFYLSCPHRPCGDATSWAPCTACVGKSALCKTCLITRRRAWVRQSNRRLKREILEHYGKACACCKESHFEFMTLDHVNGGGNQDRLKIFGIKSAAGTRFYRLLRKKGFPPGFRTLCWNCQLATGYYGRCPHAERHPRNVDHPSLDTQGARSVRS